VVMLHHLHLCHLANVYDYYSMLVWRIGILGDRIGTVFGVMPTVQGFIWCDARNMWFVIMPKSKDRFKK
jgi:hypothetical protein